MLEAAQPDRGQARYDGIDTLPHGSEIILLVEDEPALRAMAARILRESGYAVMEASNGDEALRLAIDAGGRMQLLVTDVIMPLMDGRALAEQLTSIYPEIKTLFMSGYASETISPLGEARRPEWFLQKPFTYAALARKVREVMDYRAS